MTMKAPRPDEYKLTVSSAEEAIEALEANLTDFGAPLEGELEPGLPEDQVIRETRLRAVIAWLRHTKN